MARDIPSDEARNLANHICREEWDFNSCSANATNYVGCHDDELEECLVYECARRTILWPAVFRFLREERKIISSTVGDSLWLRVFEFLKLFDEFPDTPWLKIDRVRRDDQLATFRLRGTWRPPIVEVDHFDAEVPQLTSSSDPEDDGRGPFWPEGKEILSHYKAANPYFADAFHTFRICWEHSSKRLCDAFSRWVDENRPRETEEFDQPGKQETRKDVLRNSLDGVGAWTLTHNETVSQFFSIESLIRETRKIAKDGGGAPRALYSSRKRWKRAEARAEQNIFCVVPKHVCVAYECSPTRRKADQARRGVVWVRLEGSAVVFEAE